MKQQRVASAMGLLIAGMIVLSGCASEDDVPQDDVLQETSSLGSVTTENNQSDAGAAADEPEGAETEAAGAQTSTTIPDGFPSEVPIPDFEIVNVEIDDETLAGIAGELYILQMKGTDLEADAEKIGQLLMDAGFMRTAWGITEERGATGIFILDGARVVLTAQETASGVEIEYVAGYLDPA